MAILTTRSNGQTITAPWFNSIKTVVDQDLVLTPLSVTADKTLGVDANVISADSSGGAIDLDLPALADNDKKYYILKATDLTNDVIVNPDGSDTIDGETEYTFSNIGESIAVVGDATNSNWVIVATAFDSTGGGGGGADIPSTYLVLTPETYNVSTWNTTNLSNATFTLNTTAPLKGDSSYELSNITGCVDEYAFYDSIAVPLRSRGKYNSVEFPYITDGDDDDFSIEVYDVTNSASLGALSLETAPSTSKTASLMFYTPLTCEEVRLIHHIDVENNGTSLIFDDVVFSDDPITAVNLYNTSDMTAYTPVTQGLGTLSNVEVFWKRDGDIMELQGRFTLGTISAAEVQIGLPDGATISSSLTTQTIVGYSARGVSASAGSTLIPLATGGDSYLNIGADNSSYNFDDGPRLATNIFNTNDTYSFFARVPIEGWTSETSAVAHSSDGSLEEWTAYTPTISNFGSVTNVDFNYFRSGPRLLVLGSFTAGTGVAAENSITLPENLEVDDIVIANSTILGEVYGVPSTTVAVSTRNGVAISASANKNLINLSVSIGATEINASNGNAFNAGKTIYVKLSVPIKGWGGGYKNVITPLTETAILKHVETSGTGGGTFTSGSDQTVPMNTVDGDTAWISINATSKQATIAPGKYIFGGYTMSYDTETNKGKIYDITNSATLAVGSNGRADLGANATIKSEIYKVIEFTESTVFEVRARCASTLATNGFGLPLTYGDDEVYSQIKITKLTWE